MQKRTDIKIGTAIRYKGEVWKVVKLTPKGVSLINVWGEDKTAWLPYDNISKGE